MTVNVENLREHEFLKCEGEEDDELFALGGK